MLVYNQRKRIPHHRTNGVVGEDTNNMFSFIEML